MTADTEFEVRAPMVGRIVQVLVEPGAQVAEDDELLILESMKMEIPIPSPREGIVVDVRIAAGDTVEEQQVLITLR